MLLKLRWLNINYFSSEITYNAHHFSIFAKNTFI
jgi:hypothetical protein